MTRKTVRRTVSALGVLVLTGALAACGGGRPGAAAVVDGRSISTADVEDAMRDFGDVLGYPRVAVLSALIDQPVVQAMAEENGVAVSDDQAEAALREVRESSGADRDAALSTAAIEVTRYALELTALGEALGQDVVTADVAAATADRDLVVNPRYGDVGEGGALTSPGTYSWLVPADGATTTPAP